MPRSPRIEYAGARYHVMSRGNRCEAIFLDDHDRERFLETLEETIDKTGWIIHSYVLMGNHYHLLLETPTANLRVGMD
jgi:REP element-mobilizing transposase RayT